MADGAMVMTVFGGAVVTGGTLVGAPILRAVRWADWKTSFEDALHVNVASALAMIAYFHVAMRVVWLNTPFGRKLGSFYREDRAAMLALGLGLVCMIVGYALLRRHGVVRSFFSALLVIFAFGCCCLGFLAWKT